MNPSASSAVLLAAALAACSSSVWAQPAAAHSAAPASPPRSIANPLEPQANVPAAAAPAPFAQYKRQTAIEVGPGSWRAANDTVNRIGGWRTYAREAQAAVPAGHPQAQTATATSPAGPPALPLPPTGTTPGTSPPPPAPAKPPHRH